MAVSVQKSMEGFLYDVFKLSSWNLVGKSIGPILRNQSHFWVNSLITQIALISHNYPKDTLYLISHERLQVNTIGPYIAPGMPEHFL